ncbi:NAD-dependent epimerase/dehydratase family protein [Niveibacterium terrae]|uniref:NAD-dependent epimerase/dehydratase family protein n=1 Tax=Niveibacterium terrae TaxID=3373598 RepID=UPI003A8F1DC8
MLAQPIPERRRGAVKSRILIVGSGDLARRTIPRLARRATVFALYRRPEAAVGLRALGAIPVPGDLDRPGSLKRLAGLADAVLHFAPPPPEGEADRRTARLLAALARGGRSPGTLVYVSTSGVYGDCAGELVAETHPLNPTTPRARRRVDAETRLRRFAPRRGCRLAILRAPGIHAADRLPAERLVRGDPVLVEGEDVFTNHVDADALAGLAITALHRVRGLRVYNACDGVHRKMGDYLDAVADFLGLPRPPRLSRSEITNRLSPLSLSFLSESRRLDAGRIVRELRCPPPADFLARPEHRETHDD